MMTDDLRHDVRVIAHLKRRGELDEKALAAHLAKLPDDAAAGEPTTTRFVSSPRSDSRNG